MRGLRERVSAAYAREISSLTLDKPARSSIEGLETE